MEYDELIRSFAKKHGLDGMEILDGTAALDVDGMRIAFLHDEDSNSLVLLGEIGLPPPEADGRFNELLMQANYLFRGSDGATFTQNPETKAFALMRSLTLTLLDASSLAEAVQSFANTLERWRRVLADFRPPSEPPGDAPASAGEFIPFGASGFISV